MLATTLQEMARYEMAIMEVFYPSEIQPCIQLLYLITEMDKNGDASKV